MPQQKADSPASKKRVVGEDEKEMELPQDISARITSIAHVIIGGLKGERATDQDLDWTEDRVIDFLKSLLDYERQHKGELDTLKLSKPDERFLKSIKIAVDG
jgi:hypothetical protein